MIQSTIGLPNGLSYKAITILLQSAFGTHIMHPPLQAGIPSAALGILSAVLAFRK